MAEISFISDENEYVDTKYVGDNVVKKYTESNVINYPNLVLCSDRKVDLFRVQVLQGMLRKSSYVERGNSYYVYMDIEGQMIEIGLLNIKDLKVVLSSKIFSIFDKYVCLDKEIKIHGDMLFALCIADDVES